MVDNLSAYLDISDEYISRKKSNHDGYFSFWDVVEIDEVTNTEIYAMVNLLECKHSLGGYFPHFVGVRTWCVSANIYSMFSSLCELEKMREKLWSNFEIWFFNCCTHPGTL